MGAINVSDIEIDPTIELTDKMHPTLGLGATFMVRCNFLQIYVNTYLLDNKGHLKYCTNVVCKFKVSVRGGCRKYRKTCFNFHVILYFHDRWQNDRLQIRLGQL